MAKGRQKARKSEDEQDEHTRQAFTSALAHLEEQHKADIYIYAGPLERQYERKMLFELQFKENRRENAVLLLDTYGGHADAAYKIAKAFKHRYKKFVVLIWDNCKSAGTLLCLGADSLIMTAAAELGPLDVQIPKEGEFSGHRSGLDITDTLGALQSESIRLMRSHFIDLRVGSRTQISTRDALDNATKIVCGLLAPVYAQINPLSLGESARSNSIAFHYGQRLSQGSKNLHPGALTKLISGYPSHGFVIDREEAQELFTCVKDTSDEEELFILLLMTRFEEFAERSTPLIKCLTDEYSTAPSHEEVSHDEQHASKPQKSAATEAKSAGSKKRSGSGRDRSIQDAGNGAGSEKPDAGDPGKPDADAYASGTDKKPPRKDRGVEQDKP